MSEVRIRDATLEDLDTMQVIEEASFPHPWSRRMLAKEFEHPWGRQRVATTPDGEVVGHLISWLVADEVHILDVAVHPDARRQGIGRILLEDCAAHARQKASRSISLEVRRTNESARRLYRDLGFRMIGERPRYYVSDGEDAVVLEWVL